MNIITLTLNPAFDMHCYTEKFVPFYENLAEITSCEAGGKGVNISRALLSNGISNTAYIVIGNENREDFIRNLSKDGVNYKEFAVNGRIRNNITLHTSNAPETRISFSGFSADEKIMDEIKTAFAKEDLNGAVITFTGRVPKGMPVPAVKDLLKFLKDNGAKLVIDSRSFMRADIFDVSPWLIKPNEEEIAMYSDIKVCDIDSAASAARTIREQGIENVIISLGSKGAVLCCATGLFYAIPPKTEVVSTIGAGDSMIAGFIHAASEGISGHAALQRAVAYGSAACLTEGTNPPQKEKIEEISKKVTVKKI